MSQSKRMLLLTGSPGIGKTTVVTRTVALIKTHGYIVHGIISKEKRVKGQREGFELTDLATEARATIASTRLRTGPRVGRYHVNLKDLANVGANALLSAIENSDVIVCDEIGPMEIFSPEFKRAVRAVISSGKPLLGVVHWRLRDDLIDELKSSSEVELFEVSVENRDDLPGTVAEKLISKLKGS